MTTYVKSMNWYVGVDGPERPASTCEVCEGKGEPILILAPCSAGTAQYPHRHVACPTCWRALHAYSLLHGGLGTIGWQN